MLFTALKQQFYVDSKAAIERMWECIHIDAISEDGKPAPTCPYIPMDPRSTRPDVCSTRIRKILNNYAPTASKEELKDLALSPDFLVKYLLQTGWWGEESEDQDQDQNHDQDQDQNHDQDQDNQDQDQNQDQNQDQDQNQVQDQTKDQDQNQVQDQNQGQDQNHVQDQDDNDVDQDEEDANGDTEIRVASEDANTNCEMANQDNIDTNIAQGYGDGNQDSYT
jgi:hypothetical protein